MTGSPLDAEPPSDFAATKLHLDLPVLDARFNVERSSWPAMQQSLSLTRSAYYLAHAGLLHLLEPSDEARSSRPRARLGALAAVAGLDLILSRLPPGDAWLHEEWHRAVMSRRGIHSYNGVYDFDVFASGIPVRKVRDDDLARLKRDHPAEMARLSAAGFEAQTALVLEFDRDRFFLGTRGAAVVTQWMQTVGIVGYMMTAAYDSEEVTEQIEREEGNDVADRDFTGLDPVGWVYDLYRPDEPYEARGVHPSGVGIDRYRSESDLTDAELTTLRRQAWLSLVNLLDPNLYGVYAVPIRRADGSTVRLNASLQHLLAPFGWSLRANLFVRSDRRSLFGQIYAHVSDSLVLPGVTLELVRVPLPALGTSVTPAVRAWAQPRSQRYFARSAEWGGAAALRLHVPIRATWEAFVEGSAKSDGWIPGDVFLGESLNAMVGVEAVAF